MKSDLKFFLLSIIFVSLSFALGYYYSQSPQNLITRTDIYFNPEKSDRPIIKIFGTSFCPASNQLESSISRVVDLVEDSTSVEPHYLFQKITNLQKYCTQKFGDKQNCSDYVSKKIYQNATECQQSLTNQLDKCLNYNNYLRSPSGVFYTSINGRQENNQNIREICAWKLSGDDHQKWWNFIKLINQNCTSANVDSCWSQQGKQAGLDIYKITECFNKDAFQIIEQEVEQALKFNLESVPKIIINNQLFPPTSSNFKINDYLITPDKNFRPNTIIKAICQSYRKPPQYCKSNNDVENLNYPLAIDCSNN